MDCTWEHDERRECGVAAEVDRLCRHHAAMAGVILPDPRWALWKAGLIHWPYREDPER